MEIIAGNTYWLVEVKLNKGDKICNHYSKTPKGPLEVKIVDVKYDIWEKGLVVGIITYTYKKENKYQNNEGKFFFKKSMNTGHSLDGYNNNSYLSDSLQNAEAYWNNRMTEYIDYMTSKYESKVKYFKKKMF